MDPEFKPILDNTDTDIIEIADDQPQDNDNAAAEVPASKAQDQEEPEKQGKFESIPQPRTSEQEIKDAEQKETDAKLDILPDGEGVKAAEDGGVPLYISQEDFKRKKKAERKLRMKDAEENRLKTSDSRVSFDVRALNEGRLADEDEAGQAFREERKREEKLRARHTLLLEEEYEEAVIRDVEYEEDAQTLYSQTSSISIAMSIGTDTVQLKEDFLNEFDMPSLSDFSEDEKEPLSSVLRAESFVEMATADVGVFVDPLTGEVITSSSKISLEEAQVEAEEVAPDVEDEPEECPEITDDDMPASIIDQDDDQAFDHFRETFDVQDLVEKEDIDAEANMQRAELLMITQGFLQDLIVALVKKSEAIGVDHFIRARCDKSKLMEELITVTNTFYFEKLDNIFLHGRVAEYYKRVRNMRVFSRLDHSDEANYIKRYLEALDQLDCVKNRFTAAKKKSSFLLNKIFMELYYTQNNASRCESHLEQTVRYYLSPKDSEYRKRLVDRELRLMAVKRNEISDSRLVLITMKHTLARLTTKINQLECVGEDLYINDFISIQNKVITLDKKIEERNIEEKKLRYKYQVDLHLTQHNREKALALADKLLHSQASLTQLLEKQHAMREHLYRVKMDRTKLRKQQKDLSCQGGILSMPSLMYEYDKTVEGLKVKRASVFKLRETLKNLSRRIQEYESYSI
ncbi:uncharacterized protein LOC111078304 [Drosophila obscura]|uniref:uncharacterized protein LOC111078304 n=1 Tax=Drosophila obscura TaxID=7282 RepID=UPI001BB18D26|nr:uncharacterized protein LOC111078304 [Drosophila obscura]